MSLFLRRLSALKRARSTAVTAPEVREIITDAGGVGGGSTAWADITGKPSTFAPSSHTHPTSEVTGLDTALAGKQPLATVLTNTTAAFTTAQETKLSGIATGATANASDASLRDRATHTGTQASSTISDFTEAAQDAIGAMIDVTLVYTDGTPLFQRAALTGAITASVGSNTTSLGTFTKAQLDAAVSDGNVLYVGDVTSNATHTGDVTGATALTIANDAVTFAKMQNATGAGFIGATGAGDYAHRTPTEVTAALDNFTSTLKGLVPGSGGGTTNFLRADGTWAAPPGGGATDLSYTASTRLLASSTGADVTLPLFTSTEAGLTPLSGGGTTNFLRADGTWAAPSGGGGAANYDGYSQMVPAAGLFIPNNANATALGTQAQVANRTVIAPYVPAYNVTIDQLGISVSTLLASANAKCVIYDSDSNGRPTTILRETANISAAANATVFGSITSLTLTAGKTYWIGVRASGTFTLRTLAVGALPALDYTSAATPAARQTLILTETFANAAANWTYASSQHSNALMPLVLMRVA